MTDPKFLPLGPRLSQKYIDARADLIACFGRYVTNEDIKGMVWMLQQPDFENCARRYLEALDNERERQRKVREAEDKAKGK